MGELIKSQNYGVIHKASKNNISEPKMPNNFWIYQIIQFLLLQNSEFFFLIFYSKRVIHKRSHELN